MSIFSIQKHITLQLLPLAAAMALAACSTFGPDQSSAPLVNGTNNPVFAEPLSKDDIKLTPRDMATLIFVRPGSGSVGASRTETPLNVYINGRYLASLLPGGYVEHTHCGGPVQVATVFDDARIRHLGQRGNETTVTLEAAKSYYFRVDTTDGVQKASLLQVPATSVFLGQYRRQAHALTRAPNCDALPPVLVAPAPMAATPTMAVAPVVIAAAPLAKLAVEPVQAPLESWRAAWEAGDYEAYKSFYAPGFKGSLVSRTAWEQQRRGRLNNSAKRITLESLVVSSTVATVVTDFKQVYKSKQFDDIGQKRLVWKPVNGTLKIVEEGFVAK